MAPVRRLALLVALVLATLAGAVAASAAPPPERGRAQLVGTYQRVAKDLVDPDGSLRDVYEDLLVTGHGAYRLRLRAGAALTGGTPIRVSGRLAGMNMDAATVEALGDYDQPATTGTTKVLVILAYWTAPDSVTVSQAKSQIFGDDDGWFGEASYGQLGLTGTAVGWYKITAPTGGLCYQNHWEIMDRARAKALAAGYDSADYDRTLVYFPRCGGDAAGVAGWAYQPGRTVWINGYMDRRVTVHEQGHNYGLPHAHTYTCTTGGVHVTLGSACSYSEYGDEYDAMGGSDHAGHFSAPQKDKLGWLAGKKRSLSSGATTFTLPPFEKYGGTPLAAVAAVANSKRRYWVEYRQATGYDATFPAGATAGVLVHLVDPTISAGGGPFLLDMSPQSTFSDAVIPPGGAWTSPEGIRISVGNVTANGAAVTVDGSADPPTAPSVPRTVTATGGDATAKVTWTPPASNGGATVQSYVVKASPGNLTETVSGLSATFADLTNGTTYSFTVTAKNSVGSSPASAAVQATPAAQLPSVTLTSPAPGTVGGLVTLAASATPNPASQAAISYVEFEVDGDYAGYDETAPYEAVWDSSWAGDGPHTVTATAYDENFRYATTAPVAVTVATPRPVVTITAPAGGTVVTGDTVQLAATATPTDPEKPISWVSFELTDGTSIGYAAGEAPYTAVWDVSTGHGGYDVVAKAYDIDGRTGTSAPVHVTVDHPLPSVAVTAPAEGAEVQGDAVAVTATATPNPSSNAAIDRVEFYVDGSDYLDTDYTAPYGTTWDTGSMTGEHVVTAIAYDADNRNATSAPRTVTVANPVPSVAVTSPADYAQVGEQVTLTATAAPNAVSNAAITHVTLTVDGWNVVADVAAPGPYTATWDGSGSYGQHTVVATAYDAAGRSAASPPVRFTVPPPLPTAVIAAPADGATVAGGVREVRVAAAPHPVTQSPLGWATLKVDGLAVAWADAPVNGEYVFSWEALRGDHVLTAEVFDEAAWDAAVTPAISVHVADQAGAPTAVVATAGADHTATVAWTAPDDDGGSPVVGYDVLVAGASGPVGTPTQVVASPAQVSGLPNGKPVRFYVAARTAAGRGLLSAVSNAVTPGTPATLSVAVSTTTLTYGKSVTVSGYLRRKSDAAPLAGRSVQLLRCAVGTSTCTAEKSGTTASTGKVSIAYALTATRDLRLRYLNADGSDTYLPLTSAAKKVSVRAVVTSAISRTSMLLGRSATVSGRVTPAHSGKRVYLQRLTSTGWRSLTYKTQSSTGYASFSVKPTSRGTWTYRLWWAGDADHLAAASPGRAVKVT